MYYYHVSVHVLIVLSVYTFTDIVSGLWNINSNFNGLINNYR